MVLVTLIETVHHEPAVLAAVGIAWSIVSLAALGRCFGIFPEARGLKTHGSYRVSRHPLYLGEIVSAVGLLIPVFTLTTALVFAAFVGLQLWLSLNEERALTKVFPDYKVRTARIVPFVW
jgi:protein-S-isoprenylcysteine O-methyltransferase Ste14